MHVSWFIVGHAGASGCPRSLVALEQALAALAPCSRLCRDHGEVRKSVATHARQHESPRVIVVGGAGTLRSAVEGALDADALERVRFLPLRAGSGNGVARRLPPARLEVRALADAAARSPLAASIVRCRYVTPSGESGQCHALSLVGIGALGETPGAARPLRPLLRCMQHAAWRERVNALVYGACFAGRAWAHRHGHPAELSTPQRVVPLRLVAAAVLAGPVPELPLFLPGPGITVATLQYKSGSWRLSRDKAERVRIDWPDEERRVFFVDEDPVTYRRMLDIEPMGSFLLMAQGDAR